MRWMKTRNSRALFLAGIAPTAVLAAPPALAQSSVREHVRDSIAAAETELVEAERLRASADRTRSAALMVENAGETASTLSERWSAPFKIGANTLNWSAAKQQELGLLLAAKAIDRFNEIPTDQLSDDMIRAVVTSNPDLAPLTNSVGIEKIRESLQLHRMDAAMFQANVALAQKKHDDLLTAARSDLAGIRAGQAVTQEQLSDQDAALALLTLTLADNSQQLTDATGKILASEERLMTLHRQSRAETRSNLAAILRQGTTVEAAVNRTHAIAGLQFNIVQQNKALLDGLDVRTRAIQGGVNFLQTQQFNALPPEDQLEILGDPAHPAYAALFGGMSAEKQKKAVALYSERAQSEALKREIIGTVETTMGVLNGIQTLGTTLGWKFTQNKDYQNGMKALNLAAGLGVAYMTGNPVMALGSLNSAFASPSSAPSAGEAEILAMLGMMDQKLDDLLAGQTKILNEIEKSRALSITMHQETLFRFDLVDQQFAALKQASAATIRAIIGLSSFNGWRSKCDTIRREFPGRGSLDALRVDVRSAPVEFGDCAALVDAVWTLPEGAGGAPHFFLEMASDTYVDPTGTLKSQLLTFNNEQFAPMVTLLWQTYGITWGGGKPSSSVAYQLIASLADPAANIDGLRSKGLRYGTRSADMMRWMTLAVGQGRFGGLFANLLQPDHVIEAIGSLEAMAPYLDVRDRRQVNYILYTAEDLDGQAAALDRNSGILEGKLNTALATLNIAIAQQVLLSGDYLIPNIAEIVFSPQVSDLRNNLIVALSKNPVLARNVLVYWIDGQLSKNRLLPERVGADGKIWPSSQSVDGTAENWAYNLEYYDGLLAAGTLGSSNACDAAKQSWKCLLPTAVITQAGRIILSTTRKGSDGNVETLAAYPLAVPSSYDLENRELVAHGDLVRLIEARKNLYRLAERMNIYKQLPPLEEAWILPKNALRR